MAVLGALLLVAAVVGFFLMHNARSELHAMIGAENLPVGQLEMLRQSSDQVGGQGGFRKQCELVGAAHPRPEGLLVSELSKTECVWYRYQVERHYETVHYRDGRRRRRKGKEKVSEHTSHQGYALRDNQGTLIGVDPNGTTPDQPEKVVSRFESPQREKGPNLFGIQLPNVFNNSTTIGFEYTEWVLRQGQQLYILGEVHDKIGPLVVGEPQQDGHFIISTRSEEDLRRDRKQTHRLLSIGVLAAVPLGIVLIVLDLLF